MSKPQAPTCDCGGRLSGGNKLCAECATKMRIALRELEALPALLATVATKQSRSASGPRAKHGKTTPLPYNPAAADAIRRIDDTLTRWVDACNRGEPWPALGGEAEWLTTRLPRHNRAGQALDELHGLADRCRDLIDNRGAVIFCGPCTVDGCRAPLYRRRGDQQITCLTCAAIHETTDRMAWLRDQLTTQRLPATLLLEAAELLGTHITRSRFDVWVHRGRILPHGTDRRGKPAYAVADALELATKTRRPAKTRKRDRRITVM